MNAWERIQSDPKVDRSQIYPVSCKRSLRTIELYFRSLIDSFDVLAISEHCLFEEQPGSLTSKCDNNYNCIAVSSNENPPILSGKAGHGGVALLWKISLDNYVSPLDNIDSDRIGEFNAISLNMILCLF